MTNSTYACKLNTLLVYKQKQNNYTHIVLGLIMVLSSKIGLITNNSGIEDLGVGSVCKIDEWTKIISRTSKDSSTNIYLMECASNNITSLPYNSGDFDLLVVCIPISNGGRTMVDSYSTWLKAAEKVIGPGE